MAGLESENHLPKSEFIGNGVVSVASWKKRVLEKCIDVYTANPIKFKRRKISALRDFPKDCGRLAAKISSKPSQDGVVDTAELSETVGSSVQSELKSSAQSESMESSKISVKYELLDLSKSPYLPEGQESSRSMDRPESMDLCYSSDQHELVDLLKSSDQPKQIDSSKSSDQPEAMDLSKSSDQPDTVELSKFFYQPDLRDSVKVSNQQKPPQLSVSRLEAIEENAHTKEFPQRRVSAVRDFPYGCGRNALRLTEVERQKAWAASGNRNSVREKPLVEHKPSNESANTVKDFKFEKSESSLERNKIEEIGKKFLEDHNKFSNERADTVKAIKFERNESKSEGDETNETVGKKPNKEVGAPVGKVCKKSGKSIKEKTCESEALPGSDDENGVMDRSPGDISKKLNKEVEASVGKVAKKFAKPIKDMTSKGYSLTRLDDKNYVMDLSAGGLSKKPDRGVEALMGKVSTKSSKPIKGKTLISEAPVDSDDGNDAMDQSPGEESNRLEFFSDKVIVQALMAEPNCPWRHGKRTTKFNMVSASSNKGTHRGKKEEPTTQEKSKLIYKKKNRDRISWENSEGKTEAPKDKSPSTKKRSPSKREVSFEVKDKKVTKDEGDSPHREDTQLITMLEGEEEDLPIVEAMPFNTLALGSQELSVSLIPFGISSSHDKGKSDEIVTRNKVRETLRLFQVIFRRLLQEEESTKRKEQGHNGKRVDLLAFKLLKEKGKLVNMGKQILGNVPGIEVGDEFHYRVELCIIGLHRQIQGGIDYIKQGITILATSIVASGGYADDMDSSDVLVYSGQGGNPMTGDKQPEDQKLERGNLALKNSIDSKTPVRVIRGFKESKSGDAQDMRGRTISTYTYDGLYLVEKCWKDKGPHGFSVYKFELRRISGQPELAWKIVKQVSKSKKLAHREGLCVEDISQGQEKMPICAVNTIDDDRPPSFKYITKMIYPDWYEPTPPRGCDCSNGCSDSENCSCAVKNGGELPFNHNGAIVEAKPLVYECGTSCKCPRTCHNRVSQHGITFQLEIFKTESRGWGVRSLTSIPSGSFICEYTGELLRDTEAEQRTGNDEYLFDIGHNYNDHSLWDGLSTLIPDLQSSVSCDVVENGGFTIDAAEYGSVGRFINHSCSPNLYAQNVLYDHDDKRMPHIMLFAAENIPPLQELTYHYNYTVDQVHDSNGNIKKKNCYCGSHECTGRLY